MIIWINGAFGAGKTQAAYELHRRLQHSFVFDPENAGYYIRKQMPQSLLIGDFQDYPMWREFNYSLLKYISSSYEGPIIIPMTIVSPEYFQEIIGKLQSDGADIHHFTLWASKDVLLKRLKGRGERKNSWPAQQIDRCLEGLSNKTFGQHLDTDHISTDEVVNRIAAQLNLTLLPDNRNGLQKKAHRLLTQVRHIRFFS
ncbi:AAA family ATPase [Paenibacillus radicis (ex Gao et al. 2016)]|uniref:Tunicamycin resistance protein n=1 Tax=Paenibacillus radicis (ex Gao et al. 2016) TaxID=1737354 RepID=A0A917M8G4_9BACL|nr:AAA family ATPase [Paenibacillus radicis (ex Gao et al. 2016)]GGG81852.1 tunicamycin resistance protein [Paenibacillus radicis (ex Gao et al. 2016)]